MIEDAIREFDQATVQVRKALVTTKGGAKAEVQYGVAYQRLVKLGVKPQLPQKLRP